MTARQLIEKIKKTEVKKIGKTPVVVLSLKVWREIEDYLEDLEISQSKQLAAKIKRARSQKKLYSAAEVKKLLAI
jgi:hypothetical protein